MAECKYCGKPIEWGVDEKGMIVALDPRSPVYRKIASKASGLLVQRDKDCLVSHFSTCSKIPVKEAALDNS